MIPMTKIPPKRYNDLNTYLRTHFGCRVQKISVDAGLTCPNRDGSIARGGCIYCNARGSGTGAHQKSLSIRQQLERSMGYIAKRYKAEKFIAYFQSFSNTYAPANQLKALYDEALSVPGVIGLSIGTRPDCVADTVLALLESYAQSYTVWVEYGLQSAHDRTLQLINRGHNVDRFLQTVARTRNRGIKICTHVILGLPGETRADILRTADVLADAGIDGIKLHLLYVVKGTKLAQHYQQGQYRCLGQDEYVDLVCDFLERTPANVVIQRLTGDPHKDELIAPLWALDRNETFKRIQRTLEARDTRQGRLVGNSNIAIKL